MSQPPKVSGWRGVLDAAAAVSMTAAAAVMIWVLIIPPAAKDNVKNSNYGGRQVPTEQGPLGNRRKGSGEAQPRPYRVF